MRLVILAVAVGLAGCANMTTPPDQIEPRAYQGRTYDRMDCYELERERERLNRREASLVAAHAEHHRRSNIKAFWVGVGKGDGSAAHNLATVRGYLEAADLAWVTRGCD